MDVDRSRQVNDFRLAIVQCGSDKDETTLFGAEEPKPAEHLYDSSYFHKMRKYARIICDDWFILSAEHGLIRDVSTPIEPYDTYIGSFSDDRLEAWAEQVGASLDGVAWGTIETVDILAGQAYTEPLKETLNALPCTVNYPFEDLDGGHGVQMQWIDQRIEEESADALDW